MQCMILFPGRDGRLPSAEEMRNAGFVLSAALGGVVGGVCAAGAEPALAAEEPAAYPAQPAAESRPEPGHETGPEAAGQPRP